jgi:S-adenosylmethionine:tRNA ribosyltransferase-isomerase
MVKHIPLTDFNYALPEEKIALYPLPRRDESKLLLYQNSVIDHKEFKQLPELLSADAILFFNDTKVIPARLEFRKDTGALIEIFLLHPVNKNVLPQVAMQTKSRVQWKCMLGNAKRWHAGVTLKKELHGGMLSARRLSTDGDVEFAWEPEHLSFAEVIGELGSTPLPPYIKRSSDNLDKERYQTVYSRQAGAVAAPTAGLHFTDDVIRAVRAKGIITDFITLHVSAGTFQPVKVNNAFDHTMHAEQMIISRQNVENLLLGKKIVAVGTTAMRTLESLYWYGVKLLENPGSDFVIPQYMPYEQQEKPLPSPSEAFGIIHQHMVKENLHVLAGHTSIYIVPGYDFKVCCGLITNFHQPQSTLMLLIAAFVGDDWRKIYDAALANHYRFLSYGDSSLLFRPTTAKVN